MTRPDLAWAYSELSKYVQFPGKSHMLAAKHVLRHLRGTYNKYIKFSIAGMFLARSAMSCGGRLTLIGPVTPTRADRTLDMSEAHVEWGSYFLEISSSRFCVLVYIRS